MRYPGTRLTRHTVPRCALVVYTFPLLVRCRGAQMYGGGGGRGGVGARSGALAAQRVGVRGWAGTGIIALQGVSL
eukprot:scaffold82192_cov63-Phaeocystis_antarctica.AAC.4